MIRIHGFNISQAIEYSYEGLKHRNIESYDIKLVHRPFSEYPNDIVSEGLGYGLLTSLFMNDFDTFDQLMINGERMWNGKFYDWHFDVNGNILDRGGATDAEEDIALSLILAIDKMKNGSWPNDRSDVYADRAQQILNNMWANPMISSSGYVCPGSNWGCDELINFSYFAPAWYRIFIEFDTNDSHDWNRVIDKNYELLEQTIGYSKGLVPDWNDVHGNFINNNELGYNAYGNGQYFFKDAIRTLFRIGVDYLWFRDERAKKYLLNAKTFIMNRGGAHEADFFDTNGDDLPVNDIWIFDGGIKQRKRREHSHLTIAMWSIPIALLGDAAEKKEFTNELGTFYEPNMTYWGKTKDNIDSEDIEHNEMYFDQFLAIFGALILDEQFQLT